MCELLVLHHFRILLMYNLSVGWYLSSEKTLVEEKSSLLLLVGSVQAPKQQEFAGQLFDVEILRCQKSRWPRFGDVILIERSVDIHKTHQNWAVFKIGWKQDQNTVSNIANPKSSDIHQITPIVYLFNEIWHLTSISTIDVYVFWTLKMTIS